MKSVIRKINRSIRLSAVLFVLGWSGHRGYAQDLILVNPADRGDGRTSLVNPAVAAYQDRMFAVGTRVLYYGVAGGFDFTHSYFNLTASHRTLAGIGDLGYGVQGQVLQTPMFNAVSLNALLAKQWDEKIALGANLGFTHRGFDRSTFKLEVEDDPALSSLSKWVFPDLSIGMVAVPSRYLTIAMSLNHLNRPNTALSDSVEAPLPRAFNTGIAVGYGNFRALFSIAYNERDIVPRFAIESFREALGYMRFGLSREAALMDAKVNVMSGIALNLRYTYPLNELSLATSGSPELGLEFNFDKNPSLYAMEWMAEPVPTRPAISLAHAFLVESEYDTLFITEKVIKRIIPDSIKKYLNDVPKSVFLAEEEGSVFPRLPEKIFLSEEELAHRPKIGAAKLLRRFEEEENRSGRFRVPRDTTLIKDLMAKSHTALYMQTLRDLAARVRSTPGMQSNFVTPQDGYRAHLILRYLSIFTPLTDSIKVSVADTATASRNLVERVGTNTVIPEEEVRVFLRAFERNGSGPSRSVYAPVDTFHFSLNMQETKRWGPVWGKFIVKSAEGRVILQDSAIVGQSSDHNQIVRKKPWDWKLADGSYPPEGNYYYHVEWQSADNKLYRSPERMLRIERDRIKSEIRVSRKMPQDAADSSSSRTKAFINMN